VEEDESGKSTKKLFRVTEVPTLKVIPAYEDLGLNFKAEEFLSQLDPYRLKNGLGSLEMEFDYIFFDCPPSFSKLSQMALLASEFVVIPIKPGEFEIIGLTSMLKQIDLFNQEYGHKLNYKVVMNLFRSSSRKHGEYYIRLQDDLQDMFVDEAVQLSEDITESIKKNQPLIFYKKESGVRGSFIKVSSQLAKYLK
jgi:chromosome partitioning protein